MPEFLVEPMTRRSVQLTLDWAAREGWNPGIHDADAFFAADPGGFFRATLLQGSDKQAVTALEISRTAPERQAGFDDGGPDDSMMLGAISSVAYGDRFGFIGLFIVDPSHRGRRVGKVLAEAALERLGTQRVIGVDGVLQKAGQYKSIFGFEHAWTNIRHECQPGGDKAQLPPGIECVPLAQNHLDAVQAIDLEMFMAPRPEFLRRWLSPSPHEGGRAMVCVEDGIVNGYGVIRPCVTGFKIGPLFARTPRAGRALYHALTAHIALDTRVWMDIPDVNFEAMAFAQSLGMRECFRTARMYRGGEWPLPARHIWGVTSLELG
ncbi:GNAT family N-acetyltransferase [Verrucomicrobia bacterium LW23]|nr:GNAT family N-acetyltransferase [Verrucomicrobia bacterium LW23]